MKKLFFILVLFSLSLIAANATEQDIVDRSAVTVCEFRYMPEKGRRGFCDGHADLRSLVSSKAHSSVLGARQGVNQCYYGMPVSADDILHGRVAAPAGAAGLRASLAR